MAVPKGIELAEFITMVADELRKARPTDPTTVPVMQLDEVELEMGFTIDEVAKPKISVLVFELGGERKKGETSTIRLRFSTLGKGKVWVYANELPGDGPELG
jgi:hypothetical protein